MLPFHMSVTRILDVSQRVENNRLRNSRSEIWDLILTWMTIVNFVARVNSP